MLLFPTEHCLALLRSLAFLSEYFLRNTRRPTYTLYCDITSLTLTFFFTDILNQAYGTKLMIDSRP